MKQHSVLITFAALIGFVSSTFAAGGGKLLAIPDFTKGDVIPQDAKHDWNLGPTGLRGWMYCDKMVTSAARQIAITTVDKDSPADGVIAVGDVLLGVGGKAFSYDPRTEMGKAITLAETKEGGGRLALTRWRSGESDEIVIKLPVMGGYSATAPYDCAKSQRILKLGIEALAERMKDESYSRKQGPIVRSLNGLALLANGDDKMLPLVKREAQWAADFETKGYSTWHYGYVMVFLAEYVIATGDKSVLPGLQRLALESARGQSAVGSWGHGFAKPDGRLGGYGMMNSPGLPLSMGLVLSFEAGVRDPDLARAIERSARLMRFYIGKGAVPYGDHEAWTQSHEDNGKSGKAALLFQLLGEARAVEFFARLALASHGSERDGGHTGNFFNMTWALPAIALNGPQATGAWMQEFGGWYFDLARRWDGSFPHQGPPQPQNDSYANWDSSGAYLLSLSLPLKKIMLTGKKPSLAPQLDSAAAQRIIADGRDWSWADHIGAYEKFSEAELLKRLASWSPTVRERAAMALAKRRETALPAIIKLLDSESLHARLGACQALEALRGLSAPAVPQLHKLLQHSDLWMRVKAAEALAAIGPPALVALPEMLDLIARGSSKEDPRAMEQRYLCKAVFHVLLNDAKKLEGVDRDKLRAAITRGLQNQDGHARSLVSSIYGRLSFEDIKPLLPDILKAVINPAPSGEMFADGVRVAGLKVLAKHHVEEGIMACADYVRNQNPWASQERINEILPILLQYGAHAKVAIPKLRETADYFEKDEKDFPKHFSLQKAAAVRDTVAKIEASKETPALLKLEK